MRELWDEIAIEWGSAEVEPGLRLHHGVAGAGERTAVLVHGYPQTAYGWRRVALILARAGRRVVLAD